MAEPFETYPVRDWGAYFEGQKAYYLDPKLNGLTRVTRQPAVRSLSPVITSCIAAECRIAADLMAHS